MADNDFDRRVVGEHNLRKDAFEPRGAAPVSRTTRLWHGGTHVDQTFS
jgi:hypothetical protein